MKPNHKIFLILTIIATMESCSTIKNTESHVRIETTYGDITVKLYNETPLHRDNFLKLVNSGFYNGVLFHRVIADFMIQGGDPDSRTASPTDSLGNGDAGYTIPSEFKTPAFFHKKGALAAARMGDAENPLKASSGCQFYIVEGKTFSDAELDNMQTNKLRQQESTLFQEILKTKNDEVKKYRLERNQEKLDALRDSILLEVKNKILADSTYKFSDKQRTIYKTLGGTPHLDGNYTVFGEVTEGIEVVEKISKAKTGKMDRPKENIRILKMEVVK